MLSVHQEEFVDQMQKDKPENFSVAFEAHLNQYIYEQPERGQILEGEIETISSDAIILDVGLKRAAIVPGREVSNLDDEVIAALSVGDMIPIRVSRTPVGEQDLFVSIDDALDVRSWQKAQECLVTDELMALEVIGSNRGGLLVSFDKLEGFVPNSQVPALKNIYDTQQVIQMKREMLGEKLKVKALEVNQQEERLIFSAMAAHQELRAERLASLTVGEVLTGKVANVVDFGLFVDLGGLDGLVHISELDWKNVAHPSQIARVGDDIEVQVIDIDMERERVGLSRKALLPDPWDEIESRYMPGSLVEVEITNMVDFGAFAKLPEGIEGLIHRSEMGYTVPGYVEDQIEPGKKIIVQVKRIEPERERISLSMCKVPLEKQLDWVLQDSE